MLLVLSVLSNPQNSAGLPNCTHKTPDVGNMSAAGAPLKPSCVFIKWGAGEREGMGYIKDPISEWTYQGDHFVNYING